MEGGTGTALLGPAAAGPANAASSAEAEPPTRRLDAAPGGQALTVGYVETVNLAGSRQQEAWPFARNDSTEIDRPEAAPLPGAPWGPAAGAVRPADPAFPQTVSLAASREESLAALRDASVTESPRLEVTAPDPRSALHAHADAAPDVGTPYRDDGPPGAAVEAVPARPAAAPAYARRAIDPAALYGGVDDD